MLLKGFDGSFVGPPPFGAASFEEPRPRLPLACALDYGEVGALLIGQRAFYCAGKFLVNPVLFVAVGASAAFEPDSHSVAVKADEVGGRFNVIRSP